MSLFISTRAELLKTKRSAAFWLSIIAAAFIPVIFFLAYFFKPDGVARSISQAPWQAHFMMGWKALAAFLFPMYVILICALIPQIEFKNNTWKQVFASPQSIGAIYFSKFITIHLMIFFFYLLFNLFMILTGVLISVVNSKFTFLQHSIDWQNLLKLNLKIYISVLGISAFQYWLSLRFKNFIAPVGIGLALVVGGLIAYGFRWEHIYKIPSLYPQLTFDYVSQKNRPLLEKHELNSIGYFLLFVIAGFLDMRFRKEKG